jgi:hypothetical protein
MREQDPNMSNSVAVPAPKVARTIADIEYVERTPRQESLTAQDTYSLKPHLRLLAIDHVMREAFAAAGLDGVQAKARLTPHQGLVVDLTGRAASRQAATELAGLYPVKPLWVETPASGAARC